MDAHRTNASARQDGPSRLSTRKKRPAYTLTCLACRKRKGRCDGKTPTCSMCASQSIECRYDKPPPMSQIYAMAKRLQDLEARLSNARKTSPDGITVPEVAACFDSDAHHQGAVDETQSHPITSESSLPDMIDLSSSADGKLSYHGPTSAIHNPVTTSSLPMVPDSRQDQELEDLSSYAARSRQWEPFALQNASLQLGLNRTVVDILLNIHWTWIHPVFLFIYRPTFTNDMGSGGPYCSEFLMVAVLAHATRFSHKEISPKLRQRARLLAGQELQNGSSIAAVQAMLHLSAREIGEGYVSQGWLYSGIAFRMAIDMGLFMNQKDWARFASLGKQDQEVRQRLAWSCYFWDKTMSLYLGRVPALLTRPTHEPHFLDDSDELEDWAPFYPEASHGLGAVSTYPACSGRLVSAFSNSCKLAVIINDIILTLYCRHYKAGDVAKLVRDIRQRLESWRAQTPITLKLEPECLPNLSPPPHIVIQNLLYFTSVILLHRPFSHIPTSRAATRQASRAVETLLLLYESTFALSHVLYLMAYSTYTAATVAIDDLRQGIFGSKERVLTCLRTLERASIACPAIRRSSDIIERSLLALTPDPELIASDSHTDGSKTTQWNDMPVFPFQAVGGQESDWSLMYESSVPTNTDFLDSFPQAYTDLTEEQMLFNMS